MPKICPTHKRNCLWIRLKHLILQECSQFSQTIMSRWGAARRIWRWQPQPTAPHCWWHLPQQRSQHRCRKIDSSLQRIGPINAPSTCQMKSQPARQTQPYQRIAWAPTARATWRRVMLVKTVAIHHLALDLQQWNHVSDPAQRDESVWMLVCNLLTQEQCRNPPESIFCAAALPRHSEIINHELFPFNSSRRHATLHQLSFQPYLISHVTV